MSGEGPLDSSRVKSPSPARPITTPMMFDGEHLHSREGTANGNRHRGPGTEERLTGSTPARDALPVQCFIRPT